MNKWQREKKGGALPDLALEGDTKLDAIVTVIFGHRGNAAREVIRVHAPAILHVEKDDPTVRVVISHMDILKELSHRRQQHAPH